MISRRRPVETKVNHDRWLVSYADLVTLLFALFVVMYSVSKVNEDAYRVLSETLGAAFKDRRVQQAAPVTQTNLASTTELAEQVKKTLAELVTTGKVQVNATEDWVEISVNASLLFESGSAVPGAEAKKLFARVSKLLAPYENAVEVSGHTDNVPINNRQFDNNWELSAARATAVVELLSQNGVAPARLSATGYGEFRPVADNTTEAGRAQNRRVVLLVTRRQVEQLPVPKTDETVAQMVEQAVEQVPKKASATDEETTPVPLVKPIIREDGSLLFTNDPERKQ